MNKILALSIFVILFSSVFVSNRNDAYALECEWPLNITKQFEYSDVIFYGKAISKEYTPSYDKKHQDAIVQFSVIDSFKGIAENDTVNVRSAEWLWGFNFTKGVDYVVFAYEYNDGTLLYRVCSPSGTLDYIDIEQIRQEAQKYAISSSPQNDENYVQYDLSEELFTLPPDLKKIPLPSNIRKPMIDWCEDSQASMKNNPRFWDTIPIRILSITPEFQSLHGKTDTFVIYSYVAEESCPQFVEMLGTFTSENGDVHKFALYYDGNFFSYQVDDIIPHRYKIPAPLDQLKSGISINEIRCNTGLDKIIKSSDGSPACVKPETKQKLIERGWANGELLITKSD